MFGIKPTEDVTVSTQTLCSRPTLASLESTFRYGIYFVGTGIHRGVANVHVGKEDHWSGSKWTEA